MFLLLLRSFPYLGSGSSSSHSPYSPVLCFFTLYSFLLCFFSYNIHPPQYWSSCLAVLTHFHLLTITSSSVFLCTCPNRLSLAYLIFSLLSSSLLLVSVHRVFSPHVLRSCASSLCTPKSLTSLRITSPLLHLCSSCLSLSTTVHLPITTSSSVYMS